MIWSVEWDDAAVKELRKLKRQTQQEILRYFRKCIATDEDPRRYGKPLSRELVGLWRYRVRNYRMICNIEDHTLCCTRCWPPKRHLRIIHGTV